MSEPFDPHPSTVPSASPAAPERRIFVHVMIVAVAVMFLAMVLVLYRAWLTTPVPTATFTVEGSERFEGVEIEITSLDDNAVWKRTLGAESDPPYVAIFRLPRGSYWASVIRGPRQELRVNLELRDHQISYLRLDQVLPAPATAPSPPRAASREIAP